MIKEIEILKDQFINTLHPLRIYLFGSYADNSFKNDSDMDFYIVVDDSCQDLASLTTKAYRSIRSIKTKPVDILVGTESRFNVRQHIPSVENEVITKGVLLYGT